MGSLWISLYDDYVHTVKKDKPRRCRQSKLPKPPKDFNGSVSRAVKVDRKEVRGLMVKASDLAGKK